jgi:hypothetical protein
MSQYNNQPKAFVAGEALAAYRRVKLSSGQVVYADADEKAIGVTLAAAASGAMVAVQMLVPTVKCTASAAITADAAIYARADGKVDDAGAGSGSAAIGIALEAALADGDIIECALEQDLV